MHLPWILHERHFMAHENTVQNCKMKFHGICGHELSMNIEVFYFMSHGFHKKRHSWAMKFSVLWTLAFVLLVSLDRFQHWNLCPLLFGVIWLVYFPFVLNSWPSARQYWALTEATMRWPNQIAWGEGFSWRTIWTAWEPKNNNTHATHK